jgi:hypothetical protein
VDGLANGDGCAGAVEAVLVVVQAVEHSLTDWSMFDAFDTSACASGGGTGFAAVGSSAASAVAVFV